MNFKEYSEYARRTQALVESNYIDVIHALEGIITECGELIDCDKKRIAYGKDLDVVNIMEEVGDCAWYLALLVDRTKGIEQSEIDDIPPLEKSYSDNDDPKVVLRRALSNITTILIVASSELDQLYLSEDESHVVESDQVRRVAMRLKSFCRSMRFPFAECLQLNVNKLKARYKGHTFTEEEALNRDLDTERKILEGETS